MVEIVYISGGITGIDDFRDRFNHAEIKLQQKGFFTVNPIDIGYKIENISFLELPEDEKYQKYMKADLKALLKCDSIFMLDGWEKSKGARFEHKTAAICGLKIMYEV